MTSVLICPGGTCLNNSNSVKKWHHDTRHAIAGRFDRQPSYRWVRELSQVIKSTTMENIRYVDICFFFQSKKAEVTKSQLPVEICRAVVPAEFQLVKWSRGIKFHWPARTWFPLSPIPITLHTPHFPEVDELWLHGRSWHYLWSRIHCVSVLCICSAPALVSRYSHETNSHPLLWKIWDWWTDDMWVEKVNE